MIAKQTIPTDRLMIFIDDADLFRIRFRRATLKKFRSIFLGGKCYSFLREFTGLAIAAFTD
jgi:hypothetical protein